PPGHAPVHRPVQQRRSGPPVPPQVECGSDGGSVLLVPSAANGQEGHAQCGTSGWTAPVAEISPPSTATTFRGQAGTRPASTAGCWHGGRLKTWSAWVQIREVQRWLMLVGLLHSAAVPSSPGGTRLEG